MLKPTGTKDVLVLSGVWFHGRRTLLALDRPLLDPGRPRRAAVARVRVEVLRGARSKEGKLSPICKRVNCHPFAIGQIVTHMQEDELSPVCKRVNCRKCGGARVKGG